jgi:hypothetical protein
MMIRLAGGYFRMFVYMSLRQCSHQLEEVLKQWFKGENALKLS